MKRTPFDHPAVDFYRDTSWPAQDGVPESFLGVFSVLALLSIDYFPPQEQTFSFRSFLMDSSDLV